MRSTSGRSLLRPEVERIISAIQGLQGMVVFVVSFETPIVYQFPGELPTELLSVIIPIKYVILKSKLS